MTEMKPCPFCGKQHPVEHWEVVEDIEQALTDSRAKGEGVVKLDQSMVGKK